MDGYSDTDVVVRNICPPVRGDGGTAREAPASRSLVTAQEMRDWAWDIASRWPLANLPAQESCASLAAVTPTLAFASWRIDDAWIQETAARKGDAWQRCRLVLRLYDVSLIDFNGFNAHSTLDIGLDSVAGETFVRLPRAGTSQLAEPGFLLHNGEFVAAARSVTVQLPSASPSRSSDTTALYVDDSMLPEVVASPWEGDTYVHERKRPRLRSGLRVAVLAFECTQLGSQTPLASYVSRLAAELARAGHAVHLFVPSPSSAPPRFEDAGVTVHGLSLREPRSSTDAAWAFAQAFDRAAKDEPAFDLFHLHEWASALAPWVGTRPSVLSMTSTEALRRNGGEPSDLSLEIEKLEREVAHVVDCVLVPDWLRGRAPQDLGLPDDRIHAFPMQGRGVDVWDCPFDAGEIKKSFGLGPFDRLLTFVGPLDWEAGPDLLVEALPVVLGRVSCARAVVVGNGPMHDSLWHRAHQLGVAHALRTTGHLDRDRLALLLRASEALVMPSRRRVYGDDHVVGLARRAGRAVVTTVGGPCHLVQHERDGIVTYDNPGSIVWAADRILGDPYHAQEMGEHGRATDDGPPGWQLVARRFAELCAEQFVELTQS